MLKKTDHCFTFLKGKKLPKSEKIFIFFGDLDELMVSLGLVRVFCPGKVEKIISNIQEDLIKIGGFVSGQGRKDFLTPATARLENKISQIEDRTVGEFSRPGKTKTSAFLHFSRALARRAERSAVGLKDSKLKPVVAYLNRLSLLLFWLAKKEETP